MRSRFRSTKYDFLLLVGAIALASSVAYKWADRGRVAVSATRNDEIGHRIVEYWKNLGLDTRPTEDVIVGFFLADCPWSMATVPYWNELSASLTTTNRRFVAISLSDSISTERFVQERMVTYTVLRMDRSKILARWKVVAYPTTLLITRDGTILSVWRGWFDEHALAEALQALNQTHKD